MVSPLANVCCRPVLGATLSRVLAVLALVVAPQNAIAQPDVVISQIYGGGGEIGARYRHDFVVLYNRGTSTANITGWSLQYAESYSSNWVVHGLGGAIAPAHHFLIRLHQGPGGTLDTPPPDSSGSIDINTSQGKVAIVSTGTLLIGACPTRNDIVQYIAYAHSECFRDAPRLQLSTRTAAWRLGAGCTDIGDNDRDFVAEIPFATNSSYVNHCTNGDIDLDDAKDVGVWRGPTGRWEFRTSSTNHRDPIVVTFGNASLGDRSVAGDYDGDGRIDPAVWRSTNGRWYVLTSRSHYSAYFEALASVEVGAQPVPADYDGDGRTDVASWQPTDGIWVVRDARFVTVVRYAWGKGSFGDIPVPADYDGDLKADYAVWRPATGEWWISLSSTNHTSYIVRQWGAEWLGDQPIPADYDGDGRADMAIWRAPGVWWVLTSASGFTSGYALPFGNSSTDVPVPGDYDADGVDDFAVWRANIGTWYLLQSSTNFTQYMTVPLGGGAPLGDIPIGFR